MRSNIRKIGNSVGAILPSPIIKKLCLSAGDEVEVSVKGNTIIISPIKVKPKYTLKELLAQCEQSSALPEELQQWNGMPPVGKESL